MTQAEATAGQRRVAAALGLVASGSDLWFPPTRFAPSASAADVGAPRGPSVTPHELLLTDDQRVAERTRPRNASGEPTGGRRGMVLGRDMYVGTFETDQGETKIRGTTYAVN